MNKSQNPKSKIQNYKSKVKTLTRKTGLTTDVFDVNGKVVDKMELPKEIFAAKINRQLLAQAVRVHLANQRQGTSSTKTRGEVAGSTRKIYRQKGTGRARHGSLKAPIFIGGGIVFGPKPRNFSLKLPKKMRPQALISALVSKFNSHNLLIIDNLNHLKAKTAEMIKTLKNLRLGIDNGKLTTPILLITTPNQKNLILACRNIQNLTLSPVNLLNSYTVLANQKIIFTKEALKTMINLWNKS